MPKLLFSILFPFLFFSSLAAQLPFKRILPPALDEVSGLAILSDSTFYWVNDGGNPPRLYITDRDGQLIDSVEIPFAPNRDWEAMARNEEGELFLGDIGNNCNCRQDLTIYRITPKGTLIDSIRFALSDQVAFPPSSPAHWNYDLESLVCHRDTLHLFSKNHLGQGNFYCKHYVLPVDNPTGLAQLVDSIHLRKRVVTGAAVSPDGRVALIAYHYRLWFEFLPTSKASVLLFSDFPDHRIFSGRRQRLGVWPFWISPQFESIDFWQEDTLLLGAERTWFVRPRAQRRRIAPEN